MRAGGVGSLCTLTRLVELRLNSDVFFDVPLRLYVVPLAEGPLNISVTVRLAPARAQERAGWR